MSIGAFIATPGSARVSRAGFDVSPKQSFPEIAPILRPNETKVRNGETPSPTRETRALPGVALSTLNR
jgi:hypothetical protein